MASKTGCIMLSLIESFTPSFGISSFFTIFGKEVKVSVLANSKVSVLLDLFLLWILPSQREKVLQKHPSRSVLRKRCSENLQSNFIEITLRHGCSPVNLLYICRIPLIKNTSGRLLLSSSVYCISDRFQTPFPYIKEGKHQINMCTIKTPETVVYRFSPKLEFLNILQISQESTCTTVSFLRKLQNLGL